MLPAGPLEAKALARRRRLAAARDHAMGFDRIFADPNRKVPAQLVMAYVMRAVNPGIYTHAGARVEDMYRPDRFGRTGTGRVEVTAAKQ